MDGESGGVLAVQVEKLEERIDRGERLNAKEHDEIRKQLQEVIDKFAGEALRRWPPALVAVVTFLTSLCTGLLVYLATHAGGG